MRAWAVPDDVIVPLHGNASRHTGTNESPIRELVSEYGQIVAHRRPTLRRERGEPSSSSVYKCASVSGG